MSIKVRMVTTSSSSTAYTISANIDTPEVLPGMSLKRKAIVVPDLIGKIKSGKGGALVIGSGSTVCLHWYLLALAYTRAYRSDQSPPYVQTSATSSPHCTSPVRHLL